MGVYFSEISESTQEQKLYTIKKLGKVKPAEFRAEALKQEIAFYIGIDILLQIDVLFI